MFSTAISLLSKCPSFGGAIKDIWYIRLTPDDINHPETSVCPCLSAAAEPKRVAMGKYSMILIKKTKKLNLYWHWVHLLLAEMLICSCYTLTGVKQKQLFWNSFYFEYVRQNSSPFQMLSVDLHSHWYSKPIWKLLLLCWSNAKYREITLRFKILCCVTLSRYYFFKQSRALILRTIPSCSHNLVCLL